MAKVWERITPPLVNDTAVIEWTPSTAGTHYSLINEGMAAGDIDDDDHILTITGAKKESLRINGALTGTGALHRVRVGFRYKGSAVPVIPGLEVTLFVKSVQWGSIAKLNVDTAGVWTNAQVTFNVGPGKTVAMWEAGPTRVLRFVSAPAVGGYVDPDQYEFQVDL